MQKPITVIYPESILLCAKDISPNLYQLRNEVNLFKRSSRFWDIKTKRIWEIHLYLFQYKSLMWMWETWKIKPI